jgi:hypothetical protein
VTPSTPNTDGFVSYVEYAPVVGGLSRWCYRERIRIEEPQIGASPLAPFPNEDPGGSALRVMHARCRLHPP